MIPYLCMPPNGAITGPHTRQQLCGVQSLPSRLREPVRGVPSNCTSELGMPAVRMLRRRVLLGQHQVLPANPGRVGCDQLRSVTVQGVLLAPS
jgi:hypothetical protein